MWGDQTINTNPPSERDEQHLRRKSREGLTSGAVPISNIFCGFQIKMKDFRNLYLSLFRASACEPSISKPSTQPHDAPEVASDKAFLLKLSQKMVYALWSIITTHGVCDACKSSLMWTLINQALWGCGTIQAKAVKESSWWLHEEWKVQFPKEGQLG